MGWKSRVREVVARNPEAVPPDLISQVSEDEHDSRRWPVIQKNALRTAVIGFVLVAICFLGMQLLAVRYELSAARLQIGLLISSIVFTSLFTLLGESEFEDGVKAVLILILGLAWAFWFPLPWCIIPGIGAVVASIVNWTIQASLGRYF